MKQIFFLIITMERGRFSNCSNFINSGYTTHNGIKPFTTQGNYVQVIVNRIYNWIQP
jgi:hypothetical protein